MADRDSLDRSSSEVAGGHARATSANGNDHNALESRISSEESEVQHSASALAQNESSVEYDNVLQSDVRCPFPSPETHDDNNNGRLA
jgi:hypothetical protein